MTPFAYARAADAADAIRQAAVPETRYLGGGTNLVDLMRETIERPMRLIDVTALSTAIEVRADGGLLIGAGVRNTALAEHAAVRERYPALARAILAALRARSAIWRPSAATSFSARAAPISTTPPDRAATSARPAPAATRSRASIASCDPGRIARLRRDPPVRHVRGARRAGRDRASGGERGRADAAACRAASPAGRAARYRDGAGAGRAHHRDRAAGVRSFPPLDLSQGTRSGELCLCARFGGRGARTRRGRHHWRRAPRSRWRCGQAMAGMAGRGSLARCPTGRGSLPRGGGGRAGGDAAPLRDNGFKVELARRTIEAVLGELMENGK